MLAACPHHHPSSFSCSDSDPPPFLPSYPSGHHFPSPLAGVRRRRQQQQQQRGRHGRAMQNGQTPQQQGQRRQTQDSAVVDYNHNAAAHDDFLDQMLSSLPWIDLNPAKAPWELAAANGAAGTDALHYAAAPYDESTLLASRLRQHQIGEGIDRVSQHQQHLLVSGIGRAGTDGDAGILPQPLSLGSGGDPADSGLLQLGDAFYGRFGGSLQRAAPAAAAMQQNFQHAQAGAAAAAAASSNPGGAGQAAATAGGGAAPPRQRVRARRGQATDPHSIAERMRRERIAERMKALQELVPNANKADKASMLDDIIDYVKFLQLQVKVLSMSRLGGAAAVVPLVANMSSEGRGGGAAYQAEAGADGLTVTEHQVAKMMEEDVGSAMQYLQGKGLCLMPISLASAISATHPRGAPIPGGGNLPVPTETPSSPSMSVLTVQSAVANGGDPSAKDAASVSKP